VNLMRLFRINLRVQQTEYCSLVSRYRLICEGSGLLVVVLRRSQLASVKFALKDAYQCHHAQAYTTQVSKTVGNGVTVGWLLRIVTGPHYSMGPPRTKKGYFESEASPT